MSTPASDARECVLIVDDDENIRETLGELVEMAGCSAVLASNGAEGLEAIAKHRPCLVILDLLMPVMGGLEMLEAMRKQTALDDVQVVVSTSVPGLVPAGVPVVPKPVDIEVILAWLRRTCQCAADGARPR